jgi:hypothetical protein
MGVGFVLHIQGHRGSHPRGGIDGLVGFPRPHIGAAVPSLLGLDDIFLFGEHLLWHLVFRITASGGDAL